MLVKLGRAYFEPELTSKARRVARSLVDVDGSRNSEVLSRGKNRRRRARLMVRVAPFRGANRHASESGGVAALNPRLLTFPAGRAVGLTASCAAADGNDGRNGTS